MGTQYLILCFLLCLSGFILNMEAISKNAFNIATSTKSVSNDLCKELENNQKIAVLIEIHP